MDDDQEIIDTSEENIIKELNEDADTPVGLRKYIYPQKYIKYFMQ